MKIFTIASIKGGSGKSTTAFNLGAALAARGKKTLLIDLDPQANLTLWAQASDPGTLPLEMITARRPLRDLVTSTNLDRLQICPASESLVFVPEELSSKRNRDSRLKTQIETFRHGHNLPAYILIDTPPGFGILTRNALAAADAVIIPTATQFLNLSGLISFMAHLEEIQEQLNPNLKVAGILLTRVDRRTRHAQEIANLTRKQYGKAVLRTEIRENVKLAESVSFGKPIFTYASTSHGAEDYKALTAELLNNERRRR